MVKTWSDLELAEAAASWAQRTLEDRFGVKSEPLKDSQYLS
jgi:hypothetical protein